MVECLLAGRADLEGDVHVGLQQRYPLGERPAPDGIAQQVLPALRVRRRLEPRHVREERVGDELLMAQHAGERLRLVGELRIGDDETAVPGCHREAEPAGSQCAAAGTDDDMGFTAGVLRVLPVHRPEVVDRVVTLYEGGLDALSASGPLADDERGHDAAQCHVRSACVGQGGGDEDRAGPEPELSPGERPGLRRDDAFVALEPCVFPGGPEAVDRAVDQRRVGRVQGLVAEIPTLRDARLETLDQHVGMAGELGRLGPARGGAQVGDQALLAPVPDQETGR